MLGTTLHMLHCNYHLCMPAPLPYFDQIRIALIPTSEKNSEGVHSTSHRVGSRIRHGTLQRRRMCPVEGRMQLGCHTFPGGAKGGDFGGNSLRCKFQMFFQTDVNNSSCGVIDIWYLDVICNFRFNKHEHVCVCGYLWCTHVWRIYTSTLFLEIWRENLMLSRLDWIFQVEIRCVRDYTDYTNKTHTVIEK